MTGREFAEWIQELFRLFPSVKNWFDGLGDGGSTMASAWRGILEPEDLSDAKAALRAILAGEAEPMPAFEREYCGRHVRDVCVWIRQRRDESRRKRDEQRSNERHAAESFGRKPLPGGSSRSILGQILEVMETNPGMSASDAARQVLPQASDEDGPRYNCRYCCDRGIVLVWSARSIRACLDGTLDVAANRTSCGAPCSCQAGARFVWRGSGDPPRTFSGWRSSDAVFSEERHCHCQHGDTESTEAISEFREWVAEFKLRWEQSKRHGVFDEWNQPAEAIR